MERASRRGFLAAAGGALLAGCSVADTDDRETVTAHDVPTVAGRRPPTTTATTVRCAPDCDPIPPPDVGLKPLGFAAIPEGSVGGAPVSRERRYGDPGVATTTAGDGPVPGRETVAIDAAPHPEGLFALLWTRLDGETGPPHLVRTDAAGGVRSRWRLTGQQWGLPAFLVRADGTAVVVGTVQSDRGPRQAVRGYRDGDRILQFEPHRRRTATDVATLDGDLVLLERTAGGFGHLPGVTVARTGVDGSVRWRRRLRLSDVLAGGRVIDAAAETVLTAGIDGDRNWLAAFDAGGTERWRSAVPRGRGDYRVVDLALGSTGTYVLLSSGEAWEGRSHGLLVSLDDGGGVEWLRVFDPAEDGTGVTGLSPAGVLDVQGPVMGGTGRDRERTLPWLVSLTPDGRSRWGGYHSSAAGPLTVVRGLERIGFGVVAHGHAGTRPASSAWLAWL